MWAFRGLPNILWGSYIKIKSCQVVLKAFHVFYPILIHLNVLLNSRSQIYSKSLIPLFFGTPCKLWSCSILESKNLKSIWIYGRAIDRASTPSNSGPSWVAMLLLVISSTRAILTISHYLLVSSFVSSRPPGRKMVTFSVAKVTLDSLKYVCMSHQLFITDFDLNSWSHDLRIRFSCFDFTAFKLFRKVNDIFNRLHLISMFMLHSSVI